MPKVKCAKCRHRHGHMSHSHQSSRAALAEGGYNSPGLNFDSDVSANAWHAPNLPSTGCSYNEIKATLHLADSLSSLETLVIRDEEHLMHASKCSRLCKSCCGLYNSAPSTPPAAGPATAACFSPEAERRLQEMSTPAELSVMDSAAASELGEVLSKSHHGRQCMVRQLLAKAINRVKL